MGVRVLIFIIALTCVPNYQGHAILEEILNDVVSIIYGELNEVVGECLHMNITKIDFLLYNRLNPITPIQLNANSYKYLNQQTPTKFLVHGWTGSASDDYIIDIMRSYLKRDDYNVIAVNWSEYANVNYASAHCNIPKVGKILADFVYDLVKNSYVQLNWTHLVGHSMGAHVCGYAGQFIEQATGRKVARITGLYPAGPLYLGLPDDQRLSKKDAKFVDVIHTNAGVFGYLAPLGHVDFYPNCGVEQKGCMKYKLTDNITLIKEMRNDIICHHNRSNMYFSESINSKKFVGRHCVLCNLFCSFFDKAVMGEDCSTKAKGVYYLKTNKNYPFARG